MIEIIETGQLPRRMIPKLAFDQADRKVAADLKRWVGMTDGGWFDLREFLEWFLWALALSKDEPRMSRAGANEELYRTVDVSGFLKHPYDYFGALIAEDYPRQNSGFFATPHNVVECMVQMMAFDEGLDGRYKTVCDPCVGSGRMLLHAAQYSLRLYGVDVDPMVLAACKINGALYAPWLSYPIPDGVFAREDWLTAMGNVVIDDTPVAPTGRHQKSIFDYAIEDEEEVEALN